MTPGDIIKGKYRVERVLGEGGMGVVVAAHHLALDQRVAIKLLHPALLAEPELVARFAREARAASKIESDHVARVTDVDALDDGTPFMVMEYLEGLDLSIVRKRGQGLPVPAAVGYVIEACEAIGEAHRRGIVHRDVKPANLFLAEKSDGRTRVKVLDFGISKVGGGEGGAGRVTGVGVVIGSAEYMSPEQMIAARDVDAGTDIWALGVTLYELLTAQAPFAGDTIPQICARVMAAEPAPPSTIAPEIPAGLDAVILRCLAKDRAQRYGSIAELRDALEPYAPAPYAPAASEARRSLPSLPAPLPAEPQPAPSVTAAPAVERDALAASIPRTSLRPLAIGAAVVAVGIGAILLAVLSSSPSAATPRAATPSAATPVTAQTIATAAVPAPVGTTPEPAVTMGSAAPVAAAAPAVVNVADLPDVHPTASAAKAPAKLPGTRPAPGAQPPAPARHTLD